MSRQFAWVAFAFSGLLLLNGCSGPSLVPLEGTVTMDGKPLVGATVTFDRTEGPVDQRLYQGKTDDTGRFVVGPTWEQATGAMPGKYRVLIRSIEIPPGANETTKLPPEVVPMQYRDGSITVEVPAEGNTAANFSIERGRR
ncbi:MAG: hypothetical protein KF688_05225 [Pirellulales bacterium]|nr:hypothetical protein [Pirellulales bacterium]